MTVESGKNGKVALGSSDFADVVDWNFEVTANLQEYASSSTAGHTKDVKGNFSMTGTVNVLYDQDDPIWDRVKVGDDATMLLHTDATHKWSVPSKISTMGKTVNIREGGPPTVAVGFKSQGAWTYPDGSVSAG